MESITFFPTTVWSTQCNLDNEKFFKLVKDFQQKTEVALRSNEGGYQGHEFKNQEFYDEVSNNVPILKEGDFNSFRIYLVDLKSVQHISQKQRMRMGF